MRVFRFAPARSQRPRAARWGAAAVAVTLMGAGAVIAAGTTATAASETAASETSKTGTTTVVPQVRTTGLPPDPFCVHTCGPFVFDLTFTIVLPPDLADQVRGQIGPGLQLRQEARRATDPVVAARYRAASTSTLSSAATSLRNTPVAAGPFAIQPLCVLRTGGGPDRGTFERQFAAALTGLGQANVERDPVRAASLRSSAERTLDSAAALAAPCYA